MAQFVATAIVAGAKVFGVTLSTTGTLVTFAANVITSIGSTIAMRALQGGGGGPQAAQLSLSFNPVQPRTAMIGRFLTAGSLVTWVNGTTGENPNDKAFIFIAVADHECVGLVRAWTGAGDELTFNVATANGAGRAPISQYTRGGDEFGWITFRKGDWNQTADADLIANSGGRFTSDDRGRGVAYVKLEFLYPDDDGDRQVLFPRLQDDFFRFTFEIDGYRAYDRREDDENGGSGDQRADDTTDWALSDNAVVVGENILRGLRVEDEDDPDTTNRARDIFYGLGLTDAVLPADEAEAALNACDEAVTLKAGGTERRYRVAGQIDCSTPVEETLRGITDAMAGRLVQGVNRYFFLPGVPQTAVNVGEPILDGHRRIDAPYTCQDFTPLLEAVSEVTSSYTEPEQLYRPQDITPRTSSAAEDANGGRKSLNQPLPWVFSATQCQRVAEIRLRREQYQWREELGLGPGWIALEPGDWLERDGDTVGTRTFEVAQAGVGVGDADLLMVSAATREVSADIFDWDETVDEY